MTILVADSSARQHGLESIRHLRARGLSIVDPKSDRPRVYVLPPSSGSVRPLDGRTGPPQWKKTHSEFPMKHSIWPSLSSLSLSLDVLFLVVDAADRIGRRKRGQLRRHGELARG